MFAVKQSGISQSIGLKVAVACLASLFVVILGSGLLGIDVCGARDRHDDFSKKPKFCSQTAEAAFIACGYEAKDDYAIAVGNCINLGDREERRECYKEAEAQFKETNEECRDQREARLEVCTLVGEERYDPDFDPAKFVSENIKGNDYFPLAVGNRWVYIGIFEDDEGEEVTETITVEVKDKTKSIEGVTCRVVNDRVEEDGILIEDTDDWYAERNDTDGNDNGRKDTGGNETGDVWYCGEIARNYETFDGDDPDEPELVDIDGSWKTGRDGAKPGILIQADPKPGYAYRQEVLLGDAEDVAQVLSNTYFFGNGNGEPEDSDSLDEDSDSLDYLVPQELADALCSKEEPCIVTRDLTALEPGVEERKYYAPGIGVFLEVNLETGDIVELVECNVDSKCSDLPKL